MFILVHMSIVGVVIFAMAAWIAVLSWPRLPDSGIAEVLFPSVLQGLVLMPDSGTAEALL